MAKPPYLAIDFGQQFTGLAWSEHGFFTQPLHVLPSDPPHFHRLLSDIADEITAKNIATVVIGSPDTHDDRPQKASSRSASFLGHLEQALRALPQPPELILYNEFASSVAAGTSKERNDHQAAAHFLEQFLEDTPQ